MMVAQQFIAGKTGESRTRPARDDRTFVPRNVVLKEKFGPFYRP
jgi:hypothetical protein